MAAAQDKILERMKVATMLFTQTDPRSDVACIFKDISEQEKEVKKIFDEIKTAVQQLEAKTLL